MIINVHAGHNPDGKIACGAVGVVKESTEARKIKDETITLLRSLGHTVYDCTVEDGKNASDVLQKIVRKCNEHKADLDVSIHLNAGGGEGTEVLIYSSTSKAKVYANNIVNAISLLGFKNRGIKTRSDLYVLKHTNAPALLVETFFCDSSKDVSKYNYKTIAQAIVKGITGQTVNTVSTFKVQIIVDTLNIREGAGTAYKTVGTVKKGQIYTIVDTAGSWGKLKSGAGWISINSNYVKRV